MCDVRTGRLRVACLEPNCKRGPSVAMADPGAPSQPPPQDTAAYPPPQQQPPPQEPGYPQLPPQDPQAAYPPPQAYPPQQQPPPPEPQPVPPPGYVQQPPPQAAPQTTTTVVVQQQPVTVQAVVFRDHPVTVTDSKGQQVQTVLEYRSGALTWIAFAVICLFTWELCLCCFAFIPFCIPALKDVYHITPTDGKVVGVYKRL